MQDDISGWSEWQPNFSKIEEISSPSELHGLLTGIICVTQAPSKIITRKKFNNLPTLLKLARKFNYERTNYR